MTADVGDGVPLFDTGCIFPVLVVTLDIPIDCKCGLPLAGTVGTGSCWVTAGTGLLCGWCIGLGA
jgi:hypothetical protein